MRTSKQTMGAGVGQALRQAEEDQIDLLPLLVCTYAWGGRRDHYYQLVTVLASKIHRHCGLFPFLQLFDQGLKVLQLTLHALMRTKGIPLIPILTSVAQRVQ